MIRFFATLLAAALALAGCRRGACDCVPPPVDGAKGALAYADSVVYLRPGGDYTVSPLQRRAGVYTAYPDNLTIDRNTGAVTVTARGTDGESQTGLWYLIRFRSADGKDSDSTMLLLSGLTYLDRFYNLSQNDSILRPVYNGGFDNALPTGNYGLGDDDKFAVNPTDGTINLKESIRRGFFNNTLNGSWKVATVKYALNDRSAGAPNRIDLVLYYYRSLAEVPSNVSRLMQAHQQMTMNLRNLQPIPETFGEVDNNLPSSLSLSKPRPPCVIIIGR